jgi:hypothetical protein
MKKKKARKTTVRQLYSSSSEVQMLQSCSVTFETGDAMLSITGRSGQELLALLQFTEKYPMVKKLLEQEGI